MKTSLSNKLTYRIMAVVLVMIALITGIVYFQVKRSMTEEAEERYTGVLLKTHQEFRRRLSDVYVAATNNIHDLERDIDDPDKIYEHLERVMRLNPSIVRCGLLYNPAVYSGKGFCFSTYQSDWSTMWN